MCGFIGIFGPEDTDVAQEIYEGLLAVQHRGQDVAGIITFTDAFHVKKGFGMVREVFNAANMARLRGNLGVGHVRYPTVGTGAGEDAQPFHVSFPAGVAMAHNGNVTNFAELTEKHFRKSGIRLNSSCDLEIILFVFAKALNERLRAGSSLDMEDVFFAVEEVYSQVRGAYSVVATIPDLGMVAFRDPYGIKPLCFGQKTTDQGEWFACASESVVLDVTGYKLTHDVSAGEAIFVSFDKKVTVRRLADKPHRPCIFELVYFSRPDSFLDGISVYKTRGRFGEALAEQWKATGAPMPDSIIPIPDSSRDVHVNLPNRSESLVSQTISR